MNAYAIMAELDLLNRAYQVLYMLGEEPSTVRTLTASEAACLVGIVSDLLDEEKPWTELDYQLYGRMSEAMIAYISGKQAIA